MARSSRKLTFRVLLQRRGEDANGDLLGPFATVASDDDDCGWSAQITNLRGGEAVMAQRLQGSQPVIIGVRASSVTRQIDNAWRAIDARSRQIYDITNATLSEDRVWIDILATGKVGEVLNG